MRRALICAFIGAALLAIAAAFAVTVSGQTGQPLLGAVPFPVGFVMLYRLGYDLLTGVFTLGPLAVLDRCPGAPFGSLMRNWGADLPRQLRRRLPGGHPDGDLFIRVVLAMVSDSTIGKIVAMWLPIMLLSVVPTLGNGCFRERRVAVTPSERSAHISITSM